MEEKFSEFRESDKSLRLQTLFYIKIASEFIDNV